MAYENLCMYCFEDLSGETICPHCGKDANAAVPQIQILPGTCIYHNRFLVGRAFGQDSSGIVYNALDTKRGNTIRIREYLPRNCAERLNDGSVVPSAGMEDAFETGMRKLRASVENVDDPKKKHFYFEENGTAYIAQRHSAAAAPAVEDDIEEQPGKSKVPLFIAIGAVVVAAAVIVAMMLLNNSNHDVTTDALPSASSTVSVEATWLGLQTVEPSASTAPEATKAALVDPELSWLDFTTPNPTAATTTKPSLESESTYNTVKTGSSEKSVKDLQNRLVELGWLKSSQVTGKYDETTKQAVKDFQNYVNEHCSPATKLVVDGIAGNKTQQWMYNASVALIKPTAVPTPRVTAAPNTSKITNASSKSEITSVQKKLLRLGLLNGDDVDGKYGPATKTAVQTFQVRVNAIIGYNVLEVTGEVDELTMAYLNYYVDEWAKLQSATATPRTPKATATPAAQSETIDKNSSKSKIRSLQKMLVAVGLLKDSDVDGAYGNKTVTAVRAFQEYVNTNRNSQTLKVTGTADAMTLQYLQYCMDNGISAVGLTTATATVAATQQPTTVPTAEPTAVPTEEPTPEPTAEPTAEPTQEPEVYEPENGEGNDYTGITADSEPDSIRYMQEMLSTIRLLPSDHLTGEYDDATREAVKIFQEFVNRVENREVLTLNGECDSTTQQYLEYAYERVWDVGAQMGVDVNAGNTTDGGNGGSTGEDMNTDTVTNIQSMLCIVGLMNRTNGEYDGETEQAVLNAQRFINSVVGEGTVPEDGKCDEATLSWLEQAAANGWNMADTGDQPGGFDEENADGVSVDVTEPETEVIPETVEEPVAQVSNFELALNGEAVGDSVELDSGKYSVSWTAEGVASYSLYLYTQDGTLVNKQENTTTTGFNFDTAGMVAGAAYELRIGALPEGGNADNMYWRSLYITLKVEETPEPEVEPEPIEENTPEEWIGDQTQIQDEPSEPVEPEIPAEPEVPTAYVGTPVINIDGTAYQQGGVTYLTGTSAILSWMADGDVDAYDVALFYEDGTRYALGKTTDTSKSLNLTQLLPGMYTIVVDANPIGGGTATSAQFVFCLPEDNSAASNDDSNGGAENEDNGQESDQPVNAEVMNIQMALYRYGLLNTDNISEGVLNYDTLAAVAEFQQLVNEQLGYNLPVLDPGSATSIDLETINVLLNQKPSLG